MSKLETNYRLKELELRTVSDLETVLSNKRTDDCTSDQDTSPEEVPDDLEHGSDDLKQLEYLPNLPLPSLTSE